MHIIYSQNNTFSAKQPQRPFKQLTKYHAIRKGWGDFLQLLHHNNHERDLHVKQ